MSQNIGAYDRDEEFWSEIRVLPAGVKDRDDLHHMLLFKSKVQSLNRNIEDAIRLRIAGWTASLPSGELEIDRVFAWQWRRPGPRGGRLFLSTEQAINALRKERDAEKRALLPPVESFCGCLAEPEPLSPPATDKAPNSRKDRAGVGGESFP